MAIRTETITLDVSPSCCVFARRQCVAARQGDAGMVLDVNVTENAEPLDLAGLTATLLYNNPDLVQVSGTVEGSTASFTIPSAGFSGRGVHQAYVQLAQGGTVIASTEAFDLNVAKGADLSAQQSQGYVPQLDEALATAQQASQTAEAAAEQATQAVDDANAALQTANTAVQNANDATAAANAAAENANNAAQTVRTNILTGTVGPSVVASADDAHPGALMREVQVLGQTRQNLWVNPSGTNNGVTTTGNADGSVTVSGTAIGGDASSQTRSCILLKPNTQYTLSVNSTVAGGGLFGIWMYDSSDSNIGSLSATTSGKTFTTSANISYCIFYFYANSGTTVSGTYRVMLNEGSTAEPWCPPGLTSVSELETVEAGKNLSGSKYTSTMTNAGVTFTKVSNTEFRITGTGTVGFPQVAGSNFKIAEGEYVLSATYDGSKNGEYPVLYARFGYEVKTVCNLNSTPSGKFTVDSEIASKDVYVAIVAAGNRQSHDVTMRWQIELGSTATTYEPPSVTTTPQDLDGHELRSLPDGTRDVLTWGADGTRSIDERCIATTFDGSENWTYSSDYDAFQLMKSNILDVDFSVSNVLCDKYSVATGISLAKDKQFALSGGANAIYVKDSSFGQDASAFKASLAASPMTCVLARKDTTVDLAPVPMVEQPSTTLNVWADADEGLSPEVEVTYERDLTIAYDNLASKVAALEVTQATN